MSINESDLQDLCPLLKSSFKIIFHLPNEIPTFFHDADFIQFDTEAIVMLTATAYSSQKNLRKFSVKKRRCFFEGERKLQFFATYTKSHCNFECLTNFTLRQCGCVKFSFPRIEGTPMCDVNQSKCHMKAYNDWPDEDEMSKGSIMPCNCLPPCSDIQYRIKQKQIVDLNEKSSIIIRRLRGMSK